MYNRARACEQREKGVLGVCCRRRVLLVDCAYLLLPGDCTVRVTAVVVPLWRVCANCCCVAVILMLCSYTDPEIKEYCTEVTVTPQALLWALFARSTHSRGTGPWHFVPLLTNMREVLTKCIATVRTWLVIELWGHNSEFLKGTFQVVT